MDRYSLALARYRQERGLTAALPALRAVLFDMDGVLFDSMPAHSRSWVEAAHSVGLEMQPEDAYWYEGQTGSYTIQLLYERCLGRKPSAEETKYLYELKTELFVRYDGGGILEGVPEVLAAVSDLGRLVVTGSSQPTLLSRLATAFPGVFSRPLMVTGKDVKQGKPFPEPYLMGLEKAGVAPEEALVVENAPMGVEAAVAAGIFTIAVNTGLLPDSALSDRGAHLVFPSMKALAEALPELRRRWTME